MSDSLKELLNVLGRENKSLIIEKLLSSSINSLVPFSKLRELTNINNVFWFNDSLNLINQANLSNNITFLIRSVLFNIPVLQQRVKELLSTNPTLKIDLIITDDYFTSFKYELESNPIYGDLNSIKSWKLYIKNEQDRVFQLNLHDEFNSLYLYKTPNIPYKLANWLNDYLIANPELKITHILAKGLNSSKFVSILKNLSESYLSTLTPLEKKQQLKLQNGLYGSNSNSSGKQTDLIVLERNLDYLSVVLNQLSYAGIIDEVYNIDINSIKLGQDVILLDANDPDKESLYGSIKFANFGIACDFLNTQARFLQQQYDGLQATETIEEVSNFVSQLSDLESLKQQLSTQTKISEDILNKLETSNDYSDFNILLELQQDILLQNISYSNSITRILDLVIEGYKLNDILRLICITSIVHNGLRERDYVTLNNELIESHGFENFLLLQNLIKIGLIVIRGDPAIVKSFSALNSKFQLIPSPSDEDEEENAPKNVSLEQTNANFAYRGYVPLITRILQATLKPDKRSSWEELDLNSYLLGKLVDEELMDRSVGVGGALQRDSSVFIVMIGGLTYSELATIKFVEKEFKRKFNVEKKFIVLTDCFLNAKTLINSNY